jgi:hypothetical protein
MTITGHSFSQLIDQGKVDDHLTDKLVNRPDHYTGGNVECVEAIKAATQGLPAFRSHLRRPHRPLPLALPRQAPPESPRGC